MWTNIDARDAVYDVKFAPHHLGMKVMREERERETERKDWNSERMEGLEREIYPK